MVLKLFIFMLITLFGIFNVHGEYNCEYKKDGFYADEDFCHIYWRCNYGVAEEYECPAGTAWNHIEGRCDWLDNVDCTRMDSEGNKKEPKEEPEEEVELETTKRQKTKKPLKTTPAVDETTQELVLNNLDAEIDLDKKNDPPKSQPPNTNVPNLNFNNPSNNNANSNAVQCQAFGSYYIPDPTNCASYYMCNNGKESKMNCLEKQLFNSETAQCEDFQQVFCGTRAVNLAEKNQCQSKRDGIYPDIERTCKVFYQCINQLKVREANCPNQLKFNSLTGRCDNPNNIIAPCGTYSATSSSTSILSNLMVLLQLLGLVVAFR